MASEHQRTKNKLATRSPLVNPDHKPVSRMKRGEIRDDDDRAAPRYAARQNGRAMTISTMTIISSVGTSLRMRK